MNGPMKHQKVENGLYTHHNDDMTSALETFTVDYTLLGALVMALL